MDYVLLSDIVRYCVVTIALWLIAVLLRIAYVRVRETGIRGIGRQQEHPHPLTTVGLAVLMFVSILRRFDNLGEPGDAFLWLVTTGVTLVLIGVLINVRFTFRPPWKRQ